MAEFNPFVPQPNIPDWTNAPGRLIDASGLGDIFARTATTAANIFKEEKGKYDENKLYESADAAAEAGRVESLAKAAGIPEGVAKAMKRADLYEKAFKSGRFSEGSFYSKLDVWSKEMRTKYPQYRDIIDQQIARVTGRTTANLEMDAVRRQYEADQSARSSSASQNEKFLEQHTEFLSPEEVIRIRNGDPASEALKTKAIILKGDQARLQQDWKLLEQDQKAGAIQAAPVLSQTVANIQRAFYLGAIDKGGGTLQTLRQTINRMREGGFTPEETAQAEQMIAEAKLNLQQQWIAATTTPGESGKSLQDYFASDPTAWNAQKSKLDEMAGSLDGLLTGKSGIFEWNATMEAASVNQRAAKLKDQMGADAYNGYKAIVDLVGPDQANVVYTNLVGTQGDPIQDAMTQLVFGKAIQTGDIGTATEQLAASVDESLRPAFNHGARAGVEAIAKTAFDSNLPIEARQKAFSTLVTDSENKFIRQLKDTPDNTGRSSREKFFLKMTSPEMEQTAKELGMDKEYTKWVKNTSPALMATVVEEVNATNVNTKLVDISFNPNTLQAEVTLNKTLVKDPAKLTKWLQQARTGKPLWMTDVPQDISYQDLGQLKVGLDAVQKLNMINGALTRALKSENPGMSNEDLGKAVLQYMGTLQSTYTKAEPWTTRFVEAVKNVDWLGTKAQEKWKNDQTGSDFGIVPEGDTEFNMIDDSRSLLGDDDAAAILGFVSQAEGADFNTLFGGSKVILEEKTVAEVQALQRAHGKKTGSSATGAYQVMRKTLSDLIDQGVVDPDEPFTEDVQNRIGMALLKRRGYDDWKAGKLTTDQFANRLAQEWAALPTASGKSAYEGVMGNKARTSRGDLVTMLESLKA